jgi:hypothetical protein
MAKNRAIIPEEGSMKKLAELMGFVVGLKLNSHGQQVRPE